MTRVACLCGMVCLLAAGAPAQPTSPPDLPRMPGDNPLPSLLFKIETEAEAGTGDLQDTGKSWGLDVDAAGRVLVTVQGPSGAPPVSADLLAAQGALPRSRWRHLQDAWVPATNLTELARALPPGYRLTRARGWVPTASGGEGAVAVNSAGYRDGGADGSGVRVGVIDSGWDMLSEAMLNGDAPLEFTPVNLTDHTFQSDGSHGTGCLEAVFDHAPGAEYYLYKFWTVTDFANALQHAADNGVQIMSNAIAWLGLVWADNTGAPCEAVNLAAASGVLFFTSSGNFAQLHYEDLFRPHADNPNWHDFDGTGDRFLSFSALPGDEFGASLVWNTAGGIFDYDLYLFDENLDYLDGSTASGNQFEYIPVTNQTTETRVFHLAVVRVASGITELEIFTSGGLWNEHVMPLGSTGCPANSTHPNVITVGAVDWDDYGVGTITPYSSRGPSNQGYELPHLVAPTLTSGTAFPGGMAGTSNSTPNAAGAFAAFWSADLLLDRTAVRDIIYDQAILLRDWGADGRDPVFGFGGLYLYDFAPGTIWVSRQFGNTAADRAFPFYTVAAAQAAAPIGGRLLILRGGSYPEPVILDKQLRVETLGWTAILGD